MVQLESDKQALLFAFLSLLHLNLAGACLHVKLPGTSMTGGAGGDASPGRSRDFMAKLDSFELQMHLTVMESKSHSVACLPYLFSL